MISAFGYGGQQISLVPDLDMIVVTTSDSDFCSHKESEDQFYATLDLTKRVVSNIDEKNLANTMMHPGFDGLPCH
jgi:hypothetical protein